MSQSLVVYKKISELVSGDKMKNEKHPIVIAISGVSGGGKTTITSHLNESLHNSETLFFDKYDFDGPADVIAWVDNGADYNEWNLDPLVRDIKNLRSKPLNYILLDYPFAYQNSQISNFIDFAVFLDTPLDVAMARRLLRDYKEGTSKDIMGEMENYIAQGRKGYIEMLETIKPNSDLIVDGTLPVLQIVEILTKKVVSFKKVD